MNIFFRELLDDIENLRNFAIINSGNEIGQRLNKLLDYASNCLTEEKRKEDKKKDEIEKANKAFRTEGIIKL